ncbi:hypothetical protein Chor_017302, partial [Crotalus horridus]
KKTMLSSWVVVLTWLASLKMFSVAQDSALEEAWRDWKTTYGKVYAEEEEASQRAKWEKNLQMVEQHNREADEGKHTYWMKMNQFSDLVSKLRSIPQIGCSCMLEKIFHTPMHMHPLLFRRFFLPFVN